MTLKSIYSPHKPVVSTPSSLGEVDYSCVNPKQIRKDGTISYAPFINWDKMEVLRSDHKKLLSVGMKRLPAKVWD